MIFLSLFYFFSGRKTDRAGQGGGYMPRRCTPAPQRTRTDCTAQAAGQAVPEPGRGKYQGRPCKARHTPGRWARCTGMYSIPDRPRRVDRGGGVDGLPAQYVRQSVQFRTLNFIHIYMDMFCKKH